MKKRIIQIALILFATSLVSRTVAQRFTFDPSSTWTQEYYKDDYSSNQIIITNETTEALAFRWKFVANTFPAGWNFSICDLGSCFPAPPDSNDMNVTSVGGDAYFICHTSYNGFVGAGEIQLFVFEIGDEANGDTVTFRYSTTDVLGMEPVGLDERGLTLFPNPVGDRVTLQTPPGMGISQVIVYNILGQPVLVREKEVVEPNQVLRAGHLKPGPYFVAVLYANGKRATGVFYKTNL